ncbi:MULTISPECIES: hypothetical protein [Photorhabdus]|uniref:Uncharacterized protein n=1 Tax=Photorhabdus asymbiotica subsp. asymbiotica (strain ATCC 43949 / 3105-77) TaxID=553480 RepID=B6VKQ7_PHOAA|nr:hypothetical protein [Photorhabdus asymbiotica]CAQ83555.1 conserved hypothetical protein [Photorhabdus asymbiotica]CAR66737.1 Conserved Hypothetical Protein [Photorhabdus asymbiotica subsp. asymbiotica ATCC 43949]
MSFSSKWSRGYLEPKIRELNEISFRFSLKYLSDVRSRNGFFVETNEIINMVNREIDINCLSVDGGIEIIQDEIDNLKKQEFDLLVNKSQQYMIVQK